MICFSEHPLGIHTSYANEFLPHEVVPVSRIVCPLVLIPVHSNIIKKNLWVSVSFDHVQLSTNSKSNGLLIHFDIRSQEWSWKNTLMTMTETMRVVGFEWNQYESLSMSGTYQINFTRSHWTHFHPFRPPLLMN